jgi:manganese/iron transport system substrate-binding protein
VADSSMLIVNGAGLEEFLAKLLQNAGGQRTTIEAAAGLESRKPKPGEEIVAEVHGHEGDPHFWLDPVSVIKYVENIRDGLSAVDPDGAQVYLANAQAYITKLQELDKWAAEQMKQVPDDRRVLVTNHESLGYFADRYGLRIVGAIVPSVSTGASPSAQQLAQLADAVKRAGVKAIFLETGANPQLANQLARDAGIRAVTSLYTHSVTDAKGPAPTYIDMMKYNVKAIVDALR